MLTLCLVLGAEWMRGGWVSRFLTHAKSKRKKRKEQRENILYLESQLVRSAMRRERRWIRLSDHKCKPLVTSTDVDDELTFQASDGSVQREEARWIKSDYLYSVSRRAVVTFWLKGEIMLRSSTTDASARNQANKTHKASSSRGSLSSASPLLHLLLNSPWDEAKCKERRRG